MLVSQDFLHVTLSSIQSKPHPLGHETSCSITVRNAYKISTQFQITLLASKTFFQWVPFGYPLQYFSESTTFQSSTGQSSIGQSSIGQSSKESRQDLAGLRLLPLFLRLYKQKGACALGLISKMTLTEFSYFQEICRPHFSPLNAGSNNKTWLLIQPKFLFGIIIISEEPGRQRLSGG